MTIQSILEAHQLSGAAYRGGYAYTQCSCGEQYKTKGWTEAYESWRNQHLSRILEQHMQNSAIQAQANALNAVASAWEESAQSGAHHLYARMLRATADRFLQEAK